MFKTIIFAIFLILFIFKTDAQNEFGIKGGLNFTFFKITEGTFGENPDVSIGFYGGIFKELNLDESFHLQPEILYIGIGEFRFINAPIYLEYDVNTNFHVLVGPSLNYFFDFFSNKFKVRADLSLSYDLTSKADIHLKYTLGFEELSPNVLFLGLGYKL